MFVGYEVKSQVGAARPVVLETDIKLSQAVLDPAVKSNKKEPVCVMVEHNKKQFILAVLDPSQSWQCPLDLMFAAGSEVKFFLRGSGSVHLTGFECRDELDEMDEIDMSMSSDDEEEEDNEEEVAPSKERKSKVKAIKIGVKTKIKKDAGAGDEQDSDDDDDEDDEDFDEFAGDEDDSDLDDFGEESSEDDEEMDDNDTLGQLDIEVSDEVDDEDEESD